MRLFHNITVSVFCKPEDDPARIEERLRAFVPFELEKEKLKVGRQKATGFNDRPITILDITLAKESHIAQFLRLLTEALADHQKALLRHQLESRLDEELTFFVRFDKAAWNEGRPELVDHGDCYHLKMRVAAFPKTREAALKVLQQLFLVDG
jgi:hypothetical protein